MIRVVKNDMHQELITLWVRMKSRRTEVDAGQAEVEMKPKKILLIQKRVIKP
jgi:hypothetical protein